MIYQFPPPGTIPKQLIEEANSQLQHEIFALPFRTYQVANLDGWKLYSSDTLKKKYVEVISEFKKTKKIADDIKRMVDKKKIVPCWISKGIFRLSLFKIFAPRTESGVAGFYAPKEDQIYLLMDNNMVDFGKILGKERFTFGWVPNQMLATLTIHESMHMAAENQRNSFVSLFMNEMVAYLGTVWGTLFQTKGSIEKETAFVVKFLFKEFEYKMNAQIQPFLRSYQTHLDEQFRPKSTLSMEQFDRMLLDFIGYLRLYFFQEERFYKEIRSYLHIYSALRAGYEKGLRVKGNTSLMVQELFFPSEIVCIYGELTKDMSKIYRAFQKI